jgi:DNA-directed RNA polymerase subunit RPC12/RpoP
VMTKKTPRRVSCPYCAKRVALTPKGLLYKHNDPKTHKPCVRRDPN